MRLLCFNRHQLSAFILKVTREGGEGLILRKPISVYEHGRTVHLLKLKVALSLRVYIVFYCTYLSAAVYCMYLHVLIVIAGIL
jgi:ATP-dependent DNA ligase